MLEATAVEPEGRITPGCAGLWSDDHIAFGKRITSFLKNQGAVPGIQLAHAGRKASSARPWEGGGHLKEEEGGWKTKAPSPIAFGGNLWKEPHGMTVEEIAQVQQKFVDAAVRAVKCGFEVIEIHGAHGYLIHEFYSPLSNKRTDQYGGSFDNRTRFLREIVQKVRSHIPAIMPLFVRLSTTDWSAEGWTVDDSVKLAKILKDLGVDLIDCSSGGCTPNSKDIPVGPGYQVPAAERIRKEAGILTGAVGLITTPEQAESILAENKADLILLARELLRNPYFPYQAAKKLLQKPESVLPMQYAFWLKSRI